MGAFAYFPGDLEENSAHVTELIVGPPDVRAYLADLADFLEGTFCVIARAGKSSDRRFIRDRIKYAKEHFGPWIDVVPYSEAACHLDDAYDTIIHLLDYKKSAEEIECEAEECLWEHIHFVRDEEYFQWTGAGPYAGEK